MSKETKNTYKKSTPSSRIKTSLRYVLTLGIICAVSAGLIAFTHQKTSPIVAEREYNELMEMLAQLMPEADQYEFLDVEGQEVYLGIKDEKAFASVVPGQKSGFWGPVKVLVLLNPQGEIMDVVIRDQGETPGIGTKIEDPVFLAQYAGKNIINDISIDVISGATISSKAVTSGVINAINLFDTL